MGAELRFDDFSGGLVIPVDSGSAEPGFAVATNQLLQADNVQFMPGGAVRGRRGRSKRNSVAVSGEVMSMCRFYRRQGQAYQVDTLASSASSQAAPVPPGGTAAWTSPTNALAEDASDTTVNLLAGTITEYLNVQQWGFGVPGGATVLGIQVDVKRYGDVGGGGTVRDMEVRLSKDGSNPVGADRADTATNWPGSTLTWKSYGGPTDLWSTTWTPAEINASTLAVLFAAQGVTAACVAHVDFIRVTVWWTDATSGAQFLIANKFSPNLQYRLETVTGTFTTIPTSLLIPTYKPRWVPWAEKNRVFMFDGLNDVQEFNGTTIQTSATDRDGNAPRKGPFATLWKQRLYATDPNELEFSVYATSILMEETFEAAWEPARQISVADPQGGKIVGLVAYGDRLLIFKDTSIWYLIGDPFETGGQLVMYSDKGCVAPDSIQVTPYGVVYLAQDGLYLTDGESPNPLELSAAIRPLFQGRTTTTTYRTAVAQWVPKLMACVLNLDPSVTTKTYVAFRLDGADGPRTAWAKWTAWPMNCACVWAGEGDSGQFFLADRDGYVWLADDTSLDDIQAYTVAIKTGDRVFSRDRALGNVHTIRTLYRGSVAMAGEYTYDGTPNVNLVFQIGSAQTIGYQHAQQTFWGLQSLNGRFVRIYLSNATDGPGFELHLIEALCNMRSRKRFAA